MSDSLSEALRYYDAGFSAFPLKPQSKVPAIMWKRFQTERADKAMLSNWWASMPEAGIAIVAGQISGGIAVLDVDHYEFSAWLEKKIEALGTWVVRTGSGKIHVYLKSLSECVTTELKGGADNIFLADIRGDGQGMSGPSYLAAPPTLHPSTNEPYQTLYGSPEHILTVTSANDLFVKMGEKYAGSAHLTATEGSLAVPAQLPTVVSLSQEYIADKLKAEVGITGKIRRTIQKDAMPGEGEWPNASSHSEIDFAVTCSLMDCGWTEEEVQAVFSYYPVGNNHARNPNRPGTDYLARTIGRAAERVQKQKEAARVADGENFKILRVTKIPYEEPEYDLTMTNETGQERAITIDHNDLFSADSFRKKIGKVMGELPRLKTEHAGTKRKFEAFANLILQMATLEDVPDSATKSGHFRQEIAAEIRLGIPKNRGKPGNRDEFDIMWADDSTVFIRGQKMVNHIARSTNAGAHDVWAAMRYFGGAEHMIKFEDDGTQERLWAVPIKAIEK